MCFPLSLYFSEYFCFYEMSPFEISCGIISENPKKFMFLWIRQDSAQCCVLCDNKNIFLPVIRFYFLSLLQSLYSQSKSIVGCVEFALLFSFCNIVPVRKEFWFCPDALGISISQSETGMWCSDQSAVVTRHGQHSSMFAIGIVTLTLNFKWKVKGFVGTQRW